MSNLVATLKNLCTAPTRCQSMTIGFEQPSKRDVLRLFPPPLFLHPTRRYQSSRPDLSWLQDMNSSIQCSRPPPRQQATLIGYNFLGQPLTNGGNNQSWYAHPH